VVQSQGIAMNDDSMTRAARTTAVLACLLVLGGCHRSEGPDAATPAPSAPNKATPAAVVHVDPAVADATRTMAAGVPVGASTAPVEVRFDLLTIPAAGQPFQVDVGVLPKAPAPVLHIEVSGSDGLSIDSPDAPLSVEKVQAGTLEKVTVTATSAKAGTRVLDVKVTLELPGGAETRDFVFPVIIAGGANAAAQLPIAAKGAH
jgi:hypothetical protein